MFAVIATVLTLSTIAEARDVQVQGYTRKDGTYVAPYMRTAPNSTRNDNYSTQGNINPYTGQEGTKPPDYGYVAPAPRYTAPQPPSFLDNPPIGLQQQQRQQQDQFGYQSPYQPYNPYGQ